MRSKTVFKCERECGVCGDNTMVKYEEEGLYQVRNKTLLSIGIRLLQDSVKIQAKQGMLSL